MTRILLVEDFKPLRSLIAALLSKSPGLRVVSEAEDGPGAVALARQVKPDIILMDIGLPKMNGLEAARKIFDLAPSVKIVFLTQETQRDVVEEAFDLGACGYVLKRDARTDLLAAIMAVLQGKRFVSSGLGGQLDEAEKP